MKFIDRMIQLDDTGSKTVLSDSTNDPISIAHSLLNTGGASRVSRYNYPRASEIDGACAREWVLGMTLDVEAQSVIWYGLRVVMNIGSAIHKYYQNSTALFRERIGEWYCESCRGSHPFGTRPTGKQCVFCGADARAIKYKEHTTRISEPFYGVCKYDMFISPTPGLIRMVELKGVADDKVVLRGKDRLQLCAGLLLSKYDKDLPASVDHRVGYLVYVAKKMSRAAPVKMMRVTLTEEIEKELMDFYMAVKKGVDDGELPPVPSFCTPARKSKCPVGIYCAQAK